MSRAYAAARAFLRSLHVIGSDPRDLRLAFSIALFIWRVREDLHRNDVGTFLRSLRSWSAGPRDPDVSRVVRLRNAVLAMPGFWRRNTCYVRALTLYRFVDAGVRLLRLHLGVEQRAGDRLHGHAWLTLDGQLIEAPPDVMIDALREISIDGGA